MKRSLAVLFAIIPLCSQAPRADEWWAVSNLRGFSATSIDDYKKFSPDRIQPLILSFKEEKGTVSGTDLQFVRFGESTLIGFAIDEKGMETVEVFQIDRVKRKLLYTKTRVRTDTVMALLPDMVIALVGDAVPVPNR